MSVSPAHPFHVRLIAILDEAGCERFAEEQWQPFYAADRKFKRALGTSPTVAPPPCAAPLC
jgi:hypothetical protein